VRKPQNEGEQGQGKGHGNWYLCKRKPINQDIKKGGTGIMGEAETGKPKGGKETKMMTRSQRIMLRKCWGGGAQKTIRKG